jgi:hypothetical protein
MMFCKKCNGLNVASYSQQVTVISFCLSVLSIAGDPEYPRTRSILAVGPLTVEQLSSISSGLVLL